MLTPKPRGALSNSVFEFLHAGTGSAAAMPEISADGPEDAAITLWALHELFYRGFEGVEDDLEWHPALLRLRWSLQADLEQRLRSRFTWDEEAAGRPGDFAERLFAFIADHDGPSLAAFVHRDADIEQTLELLELRSIYHLKEADPTAWVIPRLGPTAKAALAELQYDEYGAGSPRALHAELFACGLDALGLRAEYGAYIDDVPLEILEQNNAMSLFGLHRRLRGAALGHLAAFEATSSLPSRRMAQGLRRLGLAEEMAAYYDEHVEADAVHEQLAVRSICGALVAEEPALTADVFFGAFSCLDLEDRTARRLLGAWKES